MKIYLSSLLGAVSMSPAQEKAHANQIIKGVVDSHIAEVTTDKPFPFMHSRIKGSNPIHKLNFVVSITPYGLLFEHIYWYHGNRNMDEEAEYRYKVLNGFISNNQIMNIDTNNNNCRIQTDNNTISISFKRQITSHNFQQLYSEMENTASRDLPTPFIVEHNAFNLQDDSTFAQERTNILAFESQLGVVNPQMTSLSMMNIKAKYNPEMALSIFQMATHFKKNYITMQEHNGIVIIQYKKQPFSRKDSFFF